MTNPTSSTPRFSKFLLMQRSKTLRKLGGFGALHSTPRWEKYLKLGTIADELGKQTAAVMWRKRAYMLMLNLGKYSHARELAKIHLNPTEINVADALHHLSTAVQNKEPISKIKSLIEHAFHFGTPRKLVAWELSKENQLPSTNFHISRCRSLGTDCL